jgi:transposase
LCEIVEPLLPEFTAVVDVLTTGCAWRHLSPSFGIPPDRGKPGSKIHVLSDACGIPMVVAVPATNTHDSTALQPLVKAIPAIRSRRGPRRRQPVKLRADKGNDFDQLRASLRERGITAIAGPAVRICALRGARHRAAGPGPRRLGPLPDQYSAADSQRPMGCSFDVRQAS